MNKKVIIIRGLYGGRLIFVPLVHALRKARFTVHYLKFSPREDSIEGGCSKLLEVLSHCDGEELYCVTHSMGGLVLRALGNRSKENNNLARAVLIAPPNHGSLLMKKISTLPIPERDRVLNFIFGKARLDLLPDEEGMATGLPLPPCEFGIIAGGKNGTKGFSPFLPGDNDGTITVATTRIEGMKDFMLLPYMHTPIMWSRRTIRATLNFLYHGDFSE